MDDNQSDSPKFTMPETQKPQEDKVPDAPLPNEVREFKPKSSRKKLFVIIAVILALIVAGAAVWYFVLRDTNETSQKSQEENTQAEVVMPTYEGLPDTVAYAYRETENDPYILYTRPATGGDRVEVMTLQEGSFISQSAVHGDKVAIVVEPGANSTSPTAIWVSQDGGSDYELLYEGATPDEDTGFSTQITSLVFSRDESVLLAGVLDEVGAGNKVTEIPLDGSDTRTVFETEQSGVFLKGYDKQSQRIVYFEGCYNCDGNRFEELKLYDGASGNNSVIYTSEVGGLEVALHPDFTKVLLSEGTADTAEEGIGIALQPPFEVKAINLEDTSEVEVLETVNEQVQAIGYTYSGTAYYVGQQDIVKIGEAAGTAYETAGLIMRMGAYFVSDDSVVVATGEFSNFLLEYVQTGATESVGILSGDANTQIFGVAIK